MEEDKFGKVAMCLRRFALLDLSEMSTARKFPIGAGKRTLGFHFGED
jgi:hypothetical protein